MTSLPQLAADGESGTQSGRKPLPIGGDARIWPNGMPTSAGGGAKIEIEPTGFCGPSEHSSVIPTMLNGAITVAGTYRNCVLPRAGTIGKTGRKSELSTTEQLQREKALLANTQEKSGFNFLRPTATVARTAIENLAEKPPRLITLFRWAGEARIGLQTSCRRASPATSAKTSSRRSSSLLG